MVFLIVIITVFIIFITGYIFHHYYITAVIIPIIIIIIFILIFIVEYFSSSTQARIGSINLYSMDPHTSSRLASFKGLNTRISFHISTRRTKKVECVYTYIIEAHSHFKRCDINTGCLRRGNILNAIAKPGSE